MSKNEEMTYFNITDSAMEFIKQKAKEEGVSIEEKAKELVVNLIREKAAKKGVELSDEALDRILPKKVIVEE